MNKLLSYENGLEIILANTTSAQSSYRPLADSTGHVLAEDVRSDRPYPPFHRAGMDGYAVKSKDLNDGIRKFEVLGTLYAGEDTNIQPEKGKALKIMTGAPVPEGFDAVIRKEDSSQDGNSVVFTLDAIFPGKNISQMGEDAVKGDLLVPRGTIINNITMAILSAVGNNPIRVYKKPGVAIISTGSEVIDLDKRPKSFQIRNSNYYALRALLENLGIEPLFHNHISDEKEDLNRAIQKGLESADILILTGGVSKGDKDYVPELLASNGVKKLFHWLKIKPGKPIWFGKKGDKAVFGLPGNPVSAQVGFKIFVEPYIKKSVNMITSEDIILPLAGEHYKKHDLLQFVNARLTNINGPTEALPISYHGSGDFISILESQGLFIHPENQNSLAKGALVKFIPWKNIN